MRYLNWIGARGIGWLMGLLLVPGQAGMGQSHPVGPPSPVSWPIDTKIDSVLRLINTALATRHPLAPRERRRQQQMMTALFAPTGYVVVALPGKAECRVSASRFMNRVRQLGGTGYRLKTARVIHFKDVSRDRQGQYISRAVVYFDVARFDRHQPVTRIISQVTVPLAQAPPASDYWQIYELRIAEVSKRPVTARGRIGH